jgi:chemotaxis protein MotB
MRLTKGAPSESFRTLKKPAVEVAPLSKRVSYLAFALAVSACGYSEDEWQAQLAKYNQLNSAHDQEKRAHAATRAELDAAQKRVADLSEQLKKMGVNLDELNLALQQSGTEKEKLTANIDQLRQALEEYKQRAQQLERIKQRFEILRDKLKKLTDLGLKVEIRRNRMVIRLPGDVLFASGQDELKDAGKKVLDAVAEVIRNDPQLGKRYFQVAGHTDNKPLKGGRFGDNWGLSVMRARQVLIYLITPMGGKEGGGGLDPIRLHAAGYGETDPVGPNADDNGRQQNRRVELVLMPDVEEMLDLKSLI